MESLESIAFTNEDLATLQKGLDLLKDKEGFTNSFFDTFGGGSSIYGSLGIFGAEREAEKKAKREQHAEMIITLQYKLLRFKQFLKQPDFPAS